MKKFFLAILVCFITSSVVMAGFVGTGNMRKSEYDTDGDGIVESAETIVTESGDPVSFEGLVDTTTYVADKNAIAVATTSLKFNYITETAEGVQISSNSLMLLADGAGTRDYLRLGNIKAWGRSAGGGDTSDGHVLMLKSLDTRPNTYMTILPSVLDSGHSGIRLMGTNFTNGGTGLLLTVSTTIFSISHSGGGGNVETFEVEDFANGLQLNNNNITTNGTIYGGAFNDIDIDQAFSDLSDSLNNKVDNDGGTMSNGIVDNSSFEGGNNGTAYWLDGSRDYIVMEQRDGGAGDNSKAPGILMWDYDGKSGSDMRHSFAGYDVPTGSNTFSSIDIQTSGGIGEGQMRLQSRDWNGQYLPILLRTGLEVGDGSSSEFSGSVDLNAGANLNGQNIDNVDSIGVNTVNAGEIINGNVITNDFYRGFIVNNTGVQNMVAIGYDADRNASLYAISIGSGTHSNGSDGIGIGAFAHDNNVKAIGIGYNASNNSDYAVAIGSGAKNNSTYSVNIGQNSSSNNTGSVNIGRNTSNNGSLSVSIGNEANAIWQDSISIGTSAESQKLRSIAIGKNATATANDSVAIGYGAINNSTETVTIPSGWKFDAFEVESSSITASVIRTGTIEWTLDAYTIAVDTPTKTGVEFMDSNFDKWVSTGTSNAYDWKQQ